MAVEKNFQQIRRLIQMRCMEGAKKREAKAGGMKASLLFSSSDGPQTLVTDWPSGNGDELSSFALTMGMKDSWPTLHWSLSHWREKKDEKRE